MDYNIILSAIGWILAVIIPYVMIKRTMNTEKIIEISSELLDEITKNVEMQQKIYLIGVLLGKGIMDGTGVQGKGGKFNLKGVISEGIGKFIQSIIGKVAGGVAQQNVEPTFGQT